MSGFTQHDTSGQELEGPGDHAPRSDARTGDVPAAANDDPPPFMSPAATRRMIQAVIVMGVILVVGFATLVGLIIHRAASLGDTAPDASGSPAITSRGDLAKRYGVDAGRLAVALTAVPAGARVVDTTLDGDRLAITIADGSGTSIMILNAATLEREGLLHIAPTASGEK